MTPAGAGWGASSSQEPAAQGLLQGSLGRARDTFRAIGSLCFIFIHFETGSHPVLTGLELTI